MEGCYNDGLSLSHSSSPNQLIDDTHPCYAFKYLKNKPVRDLRGDDFLKIEQAESDHLIEVKVSVDIDYGSEKR